MSYSNYTVSKKNKFGCDRREETEYGSTLSETFSSSTFTI